jgi:hypothetical protein
VARQRQRVMPAQVDQRIEAIDLLDANCRQRGWMRHRATSDRMQGSGGVRRGG